MNRSVTVLSLALLVAACGNFPKDPEGTLDRVRSEGRFRVGVVAPLGTNGLDPNVANFLRAVSRAASAQPELTSGDAEPLLKKLEESELDLVIGRFDKKSPWATSVAFGPPLRTEQQGKTQFRVVPVARNGENGWIAVIEREARNAAPEAQ